MMNQTTFNKNGQVCAGNISLETNNCLVPCEGIFADVKKLPAEDIKSQNSEMFVDRYYDYKKFFEPYDGTLIYHFCVILHLKMF